MKDWNKLEADVNRILTKHFTSGRSGYKVKYVVVHYNAANLTVEGCYSVWQTREASAHYQVEDSGRIGQLVWDSDTAWHCGDWVGNCSSIGIEHANKSDGTITDDCLDNGAHLVAAICKYYGLGRPQWNKNVYPHKHFVSTSCPGQIYGSQKDAYIKRAQEWYDYMTGSGSKPSGKPSSGSSGSSSSGSSSSSSKKNLGKVNVTYELNYYGGGWLGAVKNFNNKNSEGYAGWANHKHDIFRAKVDKGSIKYRCHDQKSNKWTAWKKDWQSCEVASYIDGIQIYYTTPSGYNYQQAWYRSQTTARAGWLDVCCDDGKSVDGYDGWAGIYGEPLDRLQISIGSSNPF